MVFETVRLVLETLDEQGRADFFDWDERLQASLVSLEAEYRKLTQGDRSPIDYSELSSQAAYLYRYVYGHAEFFYDFLKVAREKCGAPLFEDTVLTITGIGGGPGSELLGLIKYLDEGNGEPDVSQIIYTIMDKEANWQHVAELIVQNIKSKIEVDLIFIEVDISGESLPPEASLHEEDAVIMSFFISEICKLPDQARIKNNIATLMKSLPSGKRVFYNDSSAYSFYSYVNNNVRSFNVIKEILDVEGKFSADSPNADGIFNDYQEDFGYGQKLSGSTVSKVLERI